MSIKMGSNKWKKVLIIALPTIIIIICSLCGWWWWFFSGDTEVVVPARSLGGGWVLSPGRDRLIYTSSGNNRSIFLMYLSTRQQYQLDRCNYSWLDNVTLICRLHIIDTESRAKLPINSINAPTSADLEELLREAGTIYKLEEYKAVAILADDYKNNPDKNYYITNIKNMDQVLQGYDYTTVPPPNDNGEAYSPNRNYYYRLENTHIGYRLVIYNAATDEKLSQAEDTNQRYDIAGWDAESRGVYYEIMPSGLFPWLAGRSGIKRLKIP